MFIVSGLKMTLQMKNQEGPFKHLVIITSACNTNETRTILDLIPRPKKVNRKAINRKKGEVLTPLGYDLSFRKWKLGRSPKFGTSFTNKNVSMRKQHLSARLHKIR